MKLKHHHEAFFSPDNPTNSRHIRDWDLQIMNLPKNPQYLQNKINIDFFFTWLPDMESLRSTFNVFIHKQVN